jgi:L-asparaginase
MNEKKTSILVIYTGGTIGMRENPATGVLSPVQFSQIEEEVPELKKFGYDITSISFDPPIDSSAINPDTWIKIATIIEENYAKFNGFVVLHGTDTMSYTASALSFILENLTKPVILTGSQLPIGMLRTDGKENLITAIQIAASLNNHKPAVPEVCIYFENKLFRGNRTTKYNAEYFNAFVSGNYPALAECGVHINFNFKAIHYPFVPRKMVVHKKMNSNIGILKLFPGIQKSMVHAVLTSKDIKAIILETFGAGNAPVDKWFIDALKAANQQGIILLNVSQCLSGRVEQGKYVTSVELQKAGLISGFDITTEAAVTKLMYLLGLGLSADEIRYQLNKSLAGEITEPVNG